MTLVIDAQQHIVALHIEIRRNGEASCETCCQGGEGFRKCGV